MLRDRKVSFAKRFLESRRVTEREIWENISLNGRKLPNRFLFVKLRKYVSDFLTNEALEPRLIGISGMRGVGKTTLLWQVADFVKKSFKDIDVFLVSMDIASAYGFDLMSILEAMSSLISSNRKVLLLFDEVQYMDNWRLC